MYAGAICTVALLAAVDEVHVRLLGADDFTVRERADAYIAQRGWAAHDTLRRGADSDDPEVRHRCIRLHDQAVEARVVLFEPVPYIDAAWYDAWPHWWTGLSPAYRLCNQTFLDRHTRMAPYLERIERDLYPWANYRHACRDWLRAELAAGTSPEALDVLLAEMRARDAALLKELTPGR